MKLLRKWQKYQWIVIMVAIIAITIGTNVFVNSKISGANHQE